MVVLPYQPTQADLDAGYSVRGAEIISCDGKRDLAVQTHAEEHRLIDEWMKTLQPKSRWRFGL